MSATSDVAPMRSALRLHSGELLSAASALVLLLVMFLVEWYGVDRIPSRGSPASGTIGAENAWNALTLVRWVMLLTIIVAIGAIALRWTRHADRAEAVAPRAVTVLGVLTSVLLVYRVLIALPSGEIVDQKLGALIGVVAAFGIALGGFESVRQQRSRTNESSTEPAGDVAADRITR